MLSLYEFVMMVTEPSYQKIELYDLDLNYIVYKGMLSNVPSRYLDYEISSIDTLIELTDTLVINVEVQ